MKDAKGHGSNGRGGRSVEDYYGPTDTKQDIANATAKFGSAPARVRTGDSDGRSSNAEAAQALMSGLKSTMVPVHDSMRDPAEAGSYSGFIKQDSGKQNYNPGAVSPYTSRNGTTDRAGIKDQVYSMLKGFGPRPDTSR